jgi:hypothetical protein
VKKAQKHEELAFEAPVRTQEKEGITIIVQGDYIGRDKPLTHDTASTIGGNVTNAQVGETLTNCTNMIQQQAPGERKDLLEELEKQVQQLLTNGVWEPMGYEIDRRRRAEHLNHSSFEQSTSDAKPDTSLVERDRRLEIIDIDVDQKIHRGSLSPAAQR